MLPVTGIAEIPLHIVSRGSHLPHSTLIESPQCLVRVRALISTPLITQFTLRETLKDQMKPLLLLLTMMPESVFMNDPLSSGEGDLLMRATRGAGGE